MEQQFNIVITAKFQRIFDKLPPKIQNEFVRGLHKVTIGQRKLAPVKVLNIHSVKFFRCGNLYRCIVIFDNNSIQPLILYNKYKLYKINELKLLQLTDSE